eukprot:TRINITY_DN13599_c0_g2_i2.p1 TRINITY_DN13599_c0_g2~~TRINITY_DN13599_c0_g2_i2.p1  ORF type:complete len:318 (-),score=47.10 TRINITY_DN13599_c0_g2_i2:117-1070(-)
MLQTQSSLLMSLVAFFLLCSCPFTMCQILYGNPTSLPLVAVNITTGQQTSIGHPDITFLYGIEFWGNQQPNYALQYTNGLYIFQGLNQTDVDQEYIIQQNITSGQILKWTAIPPSFFGKYVSPFSGLQFWGNILVGYAYVDQPGKFALGKITLDPVSFQPIYNLSSPTRLYYSDQGVPTTVTDDGIFYAVLKTLPYGPYFSIDMKSQKMLFKHDVGEYSMDGLTTDGSNIYGVDMKHQRLCRYEFSEDDVKCLSIFSFPKNYTWFRGATFSRKTFTYSAFFGWCDGPNYLSDLISVQVITRQTTAICTRILQGIVMP